MESKAELPLWATDTKLVERMLAGDVLALAKLINRVEADGVEVSEIMKLIRPHLGKAYCIGITGASGSGKSTLVDKLTGLLRQEGDTVGVICVDPSSPFSGGALLGDRIRMQGHYLDEEVFIRSMASRGSLGGLSQTIGPAIKLLDAFGKDFILVETVGVGQCELDIMHEVDVVVVVLVPKAGDAIQVMKAGLLECADIVVVNKGDYPQAQNLVAELLAIFQATQNQHIPIVVTEAIKNKGVTELWQQINNHLLQKKGRLLRRRQQQRRHEFMEILERRAIEEIRKSIEQSEQLNSYLGKVERGEVDPYSAAEEAFVNLFKIQGHDFRQNR